MTGQTPEANKSELSPDSTAVNTLAERETAIVTHEQAVLSREEAATLREEGASLREKGASQREEGAKRREEGAGLREEAANQREKARDELSSRTEKQLRDANEHLVIATIRAQTITDEAEQITAQMTHMAEHDFLTDLPNRILLTDRLEQAITLAERHDKQVALMFLDLDHFKHINDSLGHEIGDQLLQSAAKRLQACVRHSDTVSRHGGDEFVVLLPEVDKVQGAVLAAEKLIKGMAEPHLIGGHRLNVSLSIGISLYPDDAKDVEAVLRNADTAMYCAKDRGRNNYQVFTPDMNFRAVARQNIEQELRQALDQRRFVLHYQPKVNLETGAITGAEALLRWQRSDHCLVGPTQFMSIAEDCGLILKIGKWGLREACRQTQAWLQAGLELGQIAVNISTKEFLSKIFITDVRTILSDTGLEPHYLEIELTESGLMHDTQQTTATLYALKNLGVQIAVDDFGTGYSSMSNLWSFPIDTLKIDQSFVQDINGNAGEAIVSTIIAMGMSLKHRVVAEGIETKQQLAFLQSHHCAEGQGYYFGRPVAAVEFATLLGKEK
ncbi:MAG: EAL domain-containing protein [Desulfobacteraceae bacterium]|nr:MAG: EAL domain-containing protein [Desulfobacteraceae bacterium]